MMRTTKTKAFETTRPLPALFALATIAACGSTPAATPELTTPICMGVPPIEECLVRREDPASLVQAAVLVTDGTSTAKLRWTGSRLCVSGTADAGTGSGWGVVLVLPVTAFDEATEMIVAPFDARALGADRVRFTLSNPPASGLLPQIVQLTSADCKTPPDCLTAFSSAEEIFDPGTFTVPLADYIHPDADRPGTTLDQGLIAALQFYVPTLPSLPVAYDFCLDDLAFVDAAGREVRP
jgi:hypothetical protein